MGRGHIKYEVLLLAVCDVDKKHLERAVAAADEKVSTYHDFRELLARPDIDVVHIATPPHWHTIMAKTVTRTLHISRVFTAKFNRNSDQIFQIYTS